MIKNIKFKELMKTGNGKLFPVNRDAFDKKVSKLPQNIFFYMEIWKPEKQRTSPQNRYYWKCIIKVFADYCGYQMNEYKEVESQIYQAIKKKLPKRIHEECKQKFLFVGYIPNTEIEIIKSTTDLDVKEFWEYVEQIRIWLKKDYNIDTEDPEPYKKESYEIEKVKNEKISKKTNNCGS